MSEIFDICVIGGGPAGMAAAAMAAKHGLSVALIDERPSAGGQIYRGLEDGPFRSGGSMGPDYAAGGQIIRRFRAANVLALFGATLWRIDMTETGGVASYGKNGLPQRLAFRRLILATGAIERPMAFEGWTLPGVMGVGAAQLLLKTSAIVPSGRVVLAGNGPLLLLLATQLLSCGVEIAAILDTAPAVSRAAAAIANLPGLARNLDKVHKGLRMQRTIRNAGIPLYHDVSRLSARGRDNIEAVTFGAKDHKTELKVDALLVHEGIIPNTQLSRALGCRHVWDGSQYSLRPDVDRFGQSSIANVFIIGDGAAITGALAAPASAEIAVGRILEQTGRDTDASRAAMRQADAVMLRERAFRPFLDRLYPPRIAASPVSDETVVCRCEEVAAGTIRGAVKDGAIGPAQAKAFTRCGMGLCQGRTCGPIVTALIADAAGRDIADVDAYHVRFPLKPLTVQDMAQCGQATIEEECHHAA